MGKTRDLFKKIRDTRGTFHAKMGSIKDRKNEVIEIKEVKPEIDINEELDQMFHRKEQERWMDPWKIRKARKKW